MTLRGDIFVQHVTLSDFGVEVVLPGTTFCLQQHNFSGLSVGSRSRRDARPPRARRRSTVPLAHLRYLPDQTPALPNLPC